MNIFKRLINKSSKVDTPDLIDNAGYGIIPQKGPKTNEQILSDVEYSARHKLNSWGKIILDKWSLFSSRDKYLNETFQLSDDFVVSTFANESRIEFTFVDLRLRARIDTCSSYVEEDFDAPDMYNDASSVTFMKPLIVKQSYSTFMNKPLIISHKFHAYEVNVPKKMVASRVDNQYHSGGYLGGGVYGNSFMTETVKEWTEVPAHKKTEYSQSLHPEELQNIINKMLIGIEYKVTKNNIFINSHKAHVIKTLKPQNNYGHIGIF